MDWQRGSSIQSSSGRCALVLNPVHPDIQQALDEFVGPGASGKGVPGAHSEINAVNQGLFAREGPARDWYPSGALKGDSQYREGVQHGIAREHTEDGEVRSEAVYEYGILLSRSERGEDAQLREVYRLADDSPNRRLLERFRWEKGWPEFV